MIVKTWSLSSLQKRIQSMGCWYGICFLSLNMMFYDEIFLLGLALIIGKLIKINTNTLFEGHVRFTHVCMKINESKHAISNMAEVELF